MKMDKLIITGANENNLKNVNIEIPRNKLVVFTGVSGSGKTSLAFDTIYAEGQRRYMESLSSYARMFIGNMEKPDVEKIEGLSPTISIDQKTTNRNPRSTVGTVTEIYDYLRLLYAHIGKPFCPNCGKPITSMTVDQITDQVLKLENRTKIQVMAPIVRGEKGTHAKVFESMKKEGFVRVRVDGEMHELDETFELSKNKKHSIEIVIDRLIIREGIDKRLTDSIETAIKYAKGLVLINVMGSADVLANANLINDKSKSGNAETSLNFNEVGDGSTDMLLSTNFACIDCGIAFGEITSRMFSFNSPFGMCMDCNGLGMTKKIDPDLVIPDLNLSINQNAIVSLGKDKGGYYFQMVKALADRYEFSMDAPLSTAPKKFMKELLYGTKGSEPLEFDFVSKFNGPRHIVKEFEGIINNLERRYTSTNTDMMRDWVDQFMREVECETCHGDRLNKFSLSVKVGGLNISELTQLSIEDLVEFFNNLHKELTEKEIIISDQIIKEIKSRIGFLYDVGLKYLSLSRSAATLSGGESQRIRLATQIGTSLVGVLYVLDEPSIGLHQRDNAKLIKTMRNLTDIGNSVIVVEHDEETMKAADYILDMGPKAGVHGGEVVKFGTYEEIKACPESITGQYLSGARNIPVPTTRREGNGKFLEIKGANKNNLKNLSVKIPLGLLVAITGVSGSGKSTLINQTLYPVLKKHLYKSNIKITGVKEVKGMDNLDKVICIDQSPIGRTPRSNPATYTGVFDYIRDLFAMTNDAKERGYKKGRFSFNVKGGRCEACHGDGITKIEMHFLPDVYVPCDVCHGKRYSRETLEVKYKGKNIADVLDMTVEEALEFFSQIPKIQKKLQTLYDVGLSYIKLGQPSTQLSGGEAQRIKLAHELSKRSTGKTLYILDEPTTGLHAYDVHKLIEVLSKLVDQGNSVLVIEHNLDIIKSSDYLIDLGPEGGDGGGQVIAKGTPEKVSRSKKSFTGQYLKKMLK